ncbi:hypothetical protein [Lysobacter sp. Root690]|uniref:hypothetical protein n=1 Tax=Lysobacter sp. Root690 TaxID=1736588 RepID=UPI0007003B2A|nr:hypothetical protein [Lysobacter sp. Root690]KRB05108.1 hypothetical protein ASD86_16125 [Lysobacter sp. Root690]
MTMRKARLLVMLVGILLPYAARVPRGIGWLQQYTDNGIGAWLFMGAFNAIAWGAIIAVSFLYKRPSSLWAPVLLGFGFLAFAHYSLDLAADAQAAIALVFIPLYALVPIAIGAIVGYFMDRSARLASAA